MRPTIYRAICLFLLVATASLSAFRFLDNDDFIKQVLDQFRAYNQQRPTEKVYLHTDRDAYLTGETIWMKGYIVNGHTHGVDTISRVLYVDLVDPAARRIRLRLQLRATASYAPGQLFLPDSLPSGLIQTTCATFRMRIFLRKR